MNMARSLYLRSIDFCRDQKSKKDLPPAKSKCRAPFSTIMTVFIHMNNTVHSLKHKPIHSSAAKLHVTSATVSFCFAVMNVSLSAPSSGSFPRPPFPNP
jgi:hypothetical protein